MCLCWRSSKKLCILLGVWNLRGELTFPLDFILIHVVGADDHQTYPILSYRADCHLPSMKEALELSSIQRSLQDHQMRVLG